MPHRLFLVVALLSSLPTASALAEAQPAAVVSFTLDQPANVSLAVKITSFGRKMDQFPSGP